MCAVLSHSVMSDSLQRYGLQPARLLCPWGFSRQQYWSGLPRPPPGDLLNRASCTAGRFFTTEPPGEPIRSTGALGAPDETVCPGARFCILFQCVVVVSVAAVPGVVILASLRTELSTQVHSKRVRKLGVEVELELRECINSWQTDGTPERCIS